MSISGLLALSIAWSTGEDGAMNNGDTGLDRARSRRTALRAAMEGLEDAVAGPSAVVDVWTQGVRDALDAVRSALQAHIDEVEAPDGLLADVAETSPRLTAAANALSTDHAALLGAWDRAAAALDAEPIDTVKVRRRVVALLGRLTLHRQAGSDLVYEAYNTDIGGRG